MEKTSYGFMSVSTDVNLDVLNECFELVPFNGLRKPHPDDITQPPPTPPATPPSVGEPVEPIEEQERRESVDSKQSR